MDLQDLTDLKGQKSSRKRYKEVQESLEKGSDTSSLNYRFSYRALAKGSCASPACQGSCTSFLAESHAELLPGNLVQILLRELVLQGSCGAKFSYTGSKMQSSSRILRSKESTEICLQDLKFRSHTELLPRVFYFS